MRFGITSSWILITAAYVLVLSVIMFAKSDEPRVARANSLQARVTEACSPGAVAKMPGTVAVSYANVDQAGPSTSRMNCH